MEVAAWASMKRNLNGILSIKQRDRENRAVSVRPEGPRREAPLRIEAGATRLGSFATERSGGQPWGGPNSPLRGSHTNTPTQ